MTPVIQLLESGDWHVQWSPYLWAQWPQGRDCIPDDVRLGDRAPAVIAVRWRTPSMRKRLAREATAMKLEVLTALAADLRRRWEGT